MPRRHAIAISLVGLATLGFGPRDGCCQLSDPTFDQMLTVCRASIDLENAGGEKAPPSCHDMVAGAGVLHRRSLEPMAHQDLDCPPDQIAIVEVARIDNNDPCFGATYRAEGCAKEKTYECQQTEAPDGESWCHFRCEPPGGSLGPGGISSNQCAAGRPCQQPDPGEHEKNWHDHPESCWIDESGAGQDSDVDMMLFVVGLNHRAVEGAVDEAGVERLADAIVAAWPRPENVVVVSSSFTAACPPTSGVCLEKALEERYQAPFELREVPAFPPDPSTIGVLSGSRWRPTVANRRTAPSNPGSGIAEVFLRDEVSKLVVPIYALHTKDGEEALPEIESAMLMGKSSDRGRLPPIVAGDFNLAETTYIAAPIAAGVFRDEFDWVNDHVPCSSVKDLPGGVFQTQDGNKMHALLGRISPKDPGFGFPCVEGHFERVRMSYSVDVAGRLAASPPAWREGMSIYDIAHNVLAFGLRLERRRLPASCSSNTQRCKAGFKCCAPDPDDASRCGEPCIPSSRECR